MIEVINYSGAFTYECYNNAVLHVPSGAIERYRNSEGWRSFVNIVEENAVEVNTKADGVEFEFTPMEGAVTYTFDVYSDEEMTNLVKSVTVTVENNAKAMAKAAATGSETITISVDGLDTDCQYYYKITVFGDENVVLSQFSGSFNTETTGIDGISDQSLPVAAACYDAAGRKIAAPVKGLNVIRYSNGKTQKIVVK